MTYRENMKPPEPKKKKAIRIPPLWARHVSFWSLAYIAFWGVSYYTGAWGGFLVITWFGLATLIVVAVLAFIGFSMFWLTGMADDYVKEVNYNRKHE